jgi:hypothetical protein
VDVRRKALVSIVLAVASGMLLCVASASANPTVGLTPEFSSGVLAGSGSLDATLKVEGTEYGGFPPPIVGVTLGLPVGTTFSAMNHPTCAQAVLEQTGPSGCPEGSEAGPVGDALSIISFGSERVEESALVESFFAPGGGFNLFVDGHSPVSLEILAHGAVSGNVVSIEVPLVSTVPGAPYASIKELWLRLGETEEQEDLDHFTSGVTLPFECPASGAFSWAAGVTVDEGGANPPQARTTESTATTGCPSGQEPSRGKRAAEALARKHGEEEAAAKKRAEEQATVTKRHDEEVELVNLRALVKRLEEELHAAVKIRRVKLSKHGLLVTIKTFEPGLVTVGGSGLESRDETLAPGTHRIVVLLTKAGKRYRRAHRRIELSVTEKVGARTVVTHQKLKL